MALKRRNLLIIIFVLLVGGWCAASWYVGYQLEKNKDKYTQSANLFINEIVSRVVDKGITVGTANLLTLDVSSLKLVDYQRGFFTSKARYEFVGKDKTALPVEVAIAHGPFVLSELASFNFMPQFAVVDASLTLAEENKFTVPVSARIIAGFQHTEGKFDIGALTVKEESNEVTITPSVLNFDADHKFDQIALDFKLPSTVIKIENNQVQLGNLQFGITLKRGAHIAYQYAQNAAFDKLDINFVSNTSLEPTPYHIILDKVAFSTAVDEDGEKVGQQWHSEINELSVNGQSLGKLNLNNRSSDFDATAVNNILQAYAEIAATIADEVSLDESTLMDDDEMLSEQEQPSFDDKQIADEEIEPSVADEENESENGLSTNEDDSYATDDYPSTVDDDEYTSDDVVAEDNTESVVVQLIADNIDDLLFKHGAKVAVSPITWENKAGISQFDFTIALFQKADYGDGVLTSLLGQDYLNVFKANVQRFDYAFVVSLPMLKEAVMSIARLNGSSPSEATKQADQVVAMIPVGLMAAKMGDYVSNDNDKLVMRLHYENGEVTTVTGKTYPLEDFIAEFAQKLR